MMLLQAADWESIDSIIQRMLDMVRTCGEDACSCFGFVGLPSFSKAGSKRRMQGSWLKAVLAKTSLSARDWFRIAVSREVSGKLRADTSFLSGRCRRNILSSWVLEGFSPSDPSTKRVRRFDAMPPTPPSPTSCPVCKQDLVSVAALGAHHSSFHVARDNRLVTMASSHTLLQSCSSGDKLLTTRTIGTIANTAKRPQPTQWLIATDGSASPPSEEQPASVGWGFVVDRVGLLAGIEV